MICTHLEHLFKRELLASISSPLPHPSSICGLEGRPGAEPVLTIQVNPATQRKANNKREGISVPGRSCGGQLLTRSPWLGWRGEVGEQQDEKQSYQRQGYYRTENRAEVALMKVVGSTGNGEVRSNSGYILKTQVTEFPGKFHLG